MKVQALEIRIGHQIRAYCNNKMQTCTVKQILESSQDTITLLVFTPKHYHTSRSYTVRFQRQALVNLVPVV
ncbi:hypothetical protein [Aetokthonos hydrillicola]|jgi:hypothetical protein|uniref:hypothetical protein n=1 Tax=Aetokthonos hydrillicola TaxID=1550245 RepID=UPI001AFF424F|nr:hypothetical protein [Aetokthonos hydrillicola CCALA 1050]